MDTSLMPFAYDGDAPDDLRVLLIDSPHTRVCRDNEGSGSGNN
jgi:hypothetical protein